MSPWLAACGLQYGLNTTQINTPLFSSCQLKRRRKYQRKQDLAHTKARWALFQQISADTEDLHDIDRFARSVSHLLRALETFEALGIEFVSQFSAQRRWRTRSPSPSTKSHKS